MAERRKLTKTQANQYAFELHLRELWTTGISHFSQLCLCRGRIRMIANKDTGEVYTELWGTGVYLHLHWFADTIPPTIQNGKIATIIGNIATYNLNAHVSMQNCLHVPKYGAQLGREVRELIGKFVLTPKTYVPEEELTVIKARFIQARKDRIDRARRLQAK